MMRLDNKEATMRITTMYLAIAFGLAVNWSAVAGQTWEADLSQGASESRLAFINQNAPSFGVRAQPAPSAAPPPALRSNRVTRPAPAR
jgi:hypothetical protein